MLKKAGAVLASLLFLTSIGLGQDGHYEASASGAAVFTKQSNGNGVTQSATEGLDIFGTVGVHFTPRHALIFNYGRAKNSQVYQAGDNFHQLATISEYTGAYVFTPFRKGKFAPFVLAGGGALAFNPRTTWVFFPELPNNVPNNIQVNLGAVKQTELAFLYGFGVDYKLPWKFALRMQYRGFLYREPDFHVDSSAGSGVSFFTGVYGHMAEPSVGLVFRF